MIAINKLSKRKAVSPVIATVILVAVAITISIGVSYWMGSISAQYTEFEKIEITNVAISKTDCANWEAVISLKNSGSAATTITSIMVGGTSVTLGGTEVGTAGSDTVTAVPATLHTSDMPLTGLSLASGQTDEIYLWIGGNLDDSYLSSGTTVNIKIHSAGGMDYIKMVRLN